MAIYIRTGKAAERLGVSKPTVIRLFREGELEGYELPNGEIRIDEASVRRMIESGQRT